MPKEFYWTWYEPFLSIRGNLNYLNLARHGDYCEQSYRINYEKDFDVIIKH